MIFAQFKKNITAYHGKKKLITKIILSETTSNTDLDSQTMPSNADNRKASLVPPVDP